jgi:hypothetical protein
MTTPFVRTCAIADPAEMRHLRLALAETLLRDSHQPSLSARGRVAAAFDAGYLAVLVITGAGSAAGEEHPDIKTLAQGTKLLSMVPAARLDEALFFVNNCYEPDAQFDLTAMQAWAADVLKAAKG